jgi:hypothetical protein
MVYATPVPVSDFEEYRQLADGLVRYHQYGYPQSTAYRLPGYSFFMATFVAINRSVTWLSLVNIFLSTALTYLVFSVAWHITGNSRVALVSGWISALNPTFVFFAPILASEHLFTLLVFGGLLTLLSPRLTPPWRSVISGLLLGLAVLTRGEALFYFPVMILASVLYHPDHRKRYSQPIIIAFIGFFIVFPWFLRNRSTFGPGAGLSTSGGVMFYYAHHDRRLDWQTLLKTTLDGLDEVDRSRRGYQLGIEYLRSAGFPTIVIDTLISTLRLYVPNGYPVLWSLYLPRPSPDSPYPLKPLVGSTFFIWLTMMGYLFIAVLALLSPLFVKKYPAKMWVIPLGVVTMNWACYALIFTSTSRYRYTAEAMFCILAGITLVETRGWTKRIKQK